MNPPEHFETNGRTPRKVSRAGVTSTIQLGGLGAANATLTRRSVTNPIAPSVVLWWGRRGGCLAFHSNPKTETN